MKEDYQIEERPAEKGEGKVPVQVALPMAEVLAYLEHGLGELVRKVGKLFIESVLETEVEQLMGPRSQRNVAQRWRPAPNWRTSLNHFLLLWGDRIEAAGLRGGR